ncbi:hypothetical protein [uncultured Aquimarina sp.]|uniref:hypothetical protein n=1 Tax=uncultured Aquimarina sp. TaxID=575652 RepID=UPI00261EABC4|nr:hypothetical protein [uncultured Aquimarina sp.]
MGLFDQVGSEGYEDDLIYHEEQKQKEKERRANTKSNYTSNRRTRTNKKSSSFGLGKIVSVFGWVILFAIILRTCNS